MKLNRDYLAEWVLVMAKSAGRELLRVLVGTIIILFFMGMIILFSNINQIGGN